jgi:hypothetical protein
VIDLDPQASAAGWNDTRRAEMLTILGNIYFALTFACASMR